MKMVRVPEADRLWFTSDTHFLHKRMVLSKWRPFSSLEEHDQVIMDNWNSCVGKDDIIYHLGDTCFGKFEDLIKIFSQLNGDKRLVRGNHDAKFKHECLKQVFTQVNSYVELRVALEKGRQYLVLFHFPIESWHNAHKGYFHLFGHTHSNLITGKEGKRTDVGVDAWNFKPVSYFEVESLLKNRTFVSKDHHKEGTND